MSKRIITITSGKGGVGKTSIALNFALLYSKVKKTLLFDGDLGLGNVELLLGVQIQRTLEDVLKGKCGVADIMFKYKNLSIISGGSGFVKIANLSDEERNIVVSKLLALEEFETVIIDTSPGISKNVTQFLDISTDIVIVTSPELPSIIDSYQLIKTLKMQYGHTENKTINVLVNQALSKTNASSKFLVLKTSCKNYLDLKVNYLGYLSTHGAVKTAVKEQVPFVIKDLKSLPSSQIKSIFYKFYDPHIKPKEKREVEGKLSTEVLG